MQQLLAKAVPEVGEHSADDLREAHSEPRRFLHLRRGYRMPRELRTQFRELHRTDLALTLGHALFDHILIVLVAVGVVFTHRLLSPFLAVTLYVPGAVLIARCQRGLECLVHEASHRNWYRKSQRMNDLIANLMAALPVFSMVQAYRSQHMNHHHKFGTEQDADLRRYIALSIEEVDRTHLGLFAAAITARIARYFKGWWIAFGMAPTTVMAGFFWHAVVYGVIVSLWVDTKQLFVLWCLFWGVPFFLALPWLRFIAETAKHDYEGKASEFDSTINNIGLVHRLFLHPHNDGYHVTHHMFPTIPHHKTRLAHKLLAEVDTTDYRSRLRYRSRVLQEPENMFDRKS